MTTLTKQCSRPFAIVLGAILVLFAAGSRASAQLHMVETNINIESTMTAGSYPAQFKVTFFEEDGTPRLVQLSGLGATYEGAQTVKMKSGVEYDLRLWKTLWASASKIRLVAPMGWKFYISDPGSSDLIERESFLLSVSEVNTDLRIKILPHGAALASLAAGESTSLSHEGVMWSVGLGSLINGSSAGALQLRSSSIGALTFNPDDVYFSVTSPEIDYYAPNGVLQQIFAPEALVNVVDTGTDKYELRFFHWTQVGAKSGNTYPIVSGSAFVTYEISKPAADQIRIKRSSGSKTWYTRLGYSSNVWALYDWTDNGNETTQCLRYVETTLSTNGNLQYATAYEYGRPSGSSLVLSAVTRTVRQNFDWGWEMKQVIKGYGYPEAQTTNYEYWFAPSDGKGHYKRLSQIDRPDGGRTRFHYFDDFATRGLLKEKYEPFEDTNDGRLTTYTYELDVTGHAYVPDVVSEYVMNGTWQQIGKTEYDYHPETWNGVAVRRVVRREFHGSGTNDKLETTTRTYREDAATSQAYRRGLPLSVRRPDGTQTSYAYGKFGSVYVFEEMTGTSNSPSGETSVYLTEYLEDEDIDPIYIVDRKSLKRQANKNAGGRPYATYESVGVASGIFQVMSEDGYTYEATAGGRMEKRERRAYASGVPSSWNTIYEADHDGMLPSWERDEQGRKRSFTYDKQGRVSVITHDAVAAHTGFPGVAALYEIRTYDGSNRMLTSKRANAASSPTESIDSAWSYDKAGRLISKTLECCQTVNYSYPASNQVEQRNPDFTASPKAGYVLTTYFRDGTVNSVVGDAASPRYNRSRVTGGLLERWSAHESFTIGQYKNGWSVQRLDWMGRPRQVQQPTWAGGNRYTNFIYNAKGQLEQRRIQQNTASGDHVAPYRYEYDALGTIVKEGLDIGAGGSLVDNSTDRLTKIDPRFFKDGSGFWWVQAEKYVYPGTTPVLAERVRHRVAPPAGQLGVTEMYDGFGNSVVRTTSVNRSLAFVTVKTEAAPSPTNDAFVYVKSGLVLQQIDTAGVAVDYEYDNLHRRILELGRDNVMTHYTYVPGTSRVDLVRQDNGSTQITVLDYGYDTSGRVSQRLRKNVRNGVNKDEYTYYDYNKLGLVKKEYGNGVFPIEYEYDAVGRLVLMHQHRNDSGTNKTSVAWKYQGTTGLMVEKKHITNLAGYLSNPDNTANYKSTVLEYNALGLTSKRTWSRGVSTTYGYSMSGTSSTGELSSETHSDGTTTVSYTYDRMGRVKTVADATGTRTFNYDENNNLNLGGVVLPAFFGSRTLDYNYEQPGVNSDDYVHGRFKDVRYGGAVWMEKYNEQTGRWSDHMAYGDGQYLWFFTYGYDSDSHRVQSIAELEAGNYAQERHYDAWREVRSGTHTKWGGTLRTKFDVTTYTQQQQFQKVTLTRSNADSLAAKYGSGSNIVYDYAYDDRGQMSNFDVNYTGLPDTSYAYDSAGNRTQSVDQHGTSSYAVDNLNQIDPTTSGVQFAWDADGNLDEDLVWDYGYDANNRLVTMRKKDNTQYLRFTYDYMGRRMEKRVFANSTGTGTPTKHLKYLHNGMELLAELNSSGALSKSFHWGVDRSDTRGGAGGVEGLLVLHDWTTSKSYFPSYDMNGNVVGLLDTNGAFAAWYAYDPYGNIQSQGGAYAAENPIRFSTKYTDSESGLVDFGWRIYDPKKGRFITRDPIGENGGANLFRFVGNDPANRWDLWGLCATCPVSTEAGAEYREGDHVCYETVSYVETDAGRDYIGVEVTCTLSPEAPDESAWDFWDIPEPVHDGDDLWGDSHSGGENSRGLDRHRYDHKFLAHYLNPLNAVVGAVNGGYGPRFDLAEQSMLDAFKSTPATRQAIDAMRMDVHRLIAGKSGTIDGTVQSRIVDNTAYIFSLGRGHIGGDFSVYVGADGVAKGVLYVTYSDSFEDPLTPLLGVGNTQIGEHFIELGTPFEISGSFFVPYP
ncbi:hypothetical protein ASA1KI_08870 [Opitutales bacterium ASA1]|uniref:RHS repeat domain-containing protein n=1 Tax=Congregicoccus parvus TaxID=3081749 RepID=UPI002B28E3E5|nr:hypothetical protein ASA1KI_08870 [Opitutales bacterium ASA1]